MTSRIKDPALAQLLDPAELDWQRYVTPVTQHYVRQVEGCDFRGKTVAGWQHITLNTVSMMLALKRAGAEVVLGACNVDSTDDRVAALLDAEGVTVLAQSGMSRAQYQQNMNTIRAAEADVLCDMGGELICAYANQPSVLGALEATTSGLTQLRDKKIPFPVFDWNSIPLKDNLENRFHVGDGVWPAFSHVTTVSVFGKRVLVLGYGPVGKGIAERARALGGLVTVVDLDPVRLLEARHHGCAIAALDEALPSADIIVTATGAEGVLAEVQLKRAKPGVMVFNAGHSNREIDIDWLYAQPHRRMKAHIERFDLSKTHHLFLLAQGSLLNLAAGAGPHGNDLFDLYTAVMLAGMAWILQGLPPSIKPGLQPYPKHLERDIASRAVQLTQGGD